MTAYNVVRMRVKPGHEEEFLANFNARPAEMVESMLSKGLRKMSVIKTGDRSYCVIGEWDTMNGIVAARPEMIKRLDEQRDMLEDLGGGLGVTDPVSGEAVVEMRADE